MKVFNIEEKNGKKEYVCYIQLKDILYLEENGLDLETAKDVNKYMYVFSKSSLKSFVRVEIVNDVIKIRENSDCIIDLGEVLANGGVSSYDKTIKEEKEDMEASMKKFWDKCSGFYKGHLSEEPLYNEWREKGIKLKNRIEDLKDIDDMVKGIGEVNIPQEPFYNALLKRVGDIHVYRGINPNEYIILNKNGESFSNDVRTRIKNYADKELSASLVPPVTFNCIYRDILGKYDDIEELEFKHMISDDNKYIIVRVKPPVKKYNKTKELVK